MRLGYLVIVACTAAACRFPSLPRLQGDATIADGLANQDVRPDAAQACCELTAIVPPIAHVGTDIILEGTFQPTLSVTFPGATAVEATLMGVHRARVTVPPAATAGDLYASANGFALGPMPFRTTSFAPGLGSFVELDHQADLGRTPPVLSSPRSLATTAVTSRYLYVVGGFSGATSVTTIDSATINADGTLGVFGILPGITLETARAGHSSVTIGNQIYVIGGEDVTNTPLSSVEATTIDENGSIATFHAVSAASLVTPRFGHASAVVGDYLYVIGGRGTTELATIERALINPDGTLATFATVADVALVNARDRATCQVIGDYLYVIGGEDHPGGTALSSVERAPIDTTTGALGPFVVLSGIGLGTGRAGTSSVVVDKMLFVIGGSNGGPLNTTETTTITGDGSITSFVPGAGLASARSDHATAIIGTSVYVFGGTATQTLSTVERAPLVTSPGFLPFSIDPDSSQSTSRDGACSVVLGRYLYDIGGNTVGANGALTSVERATIAPDDSIGAFSIVNDVALATPRSRAACAVIGGSLYVIGGENTGGQPLGDMERATINADGTIGSFSSVPMMLATARFGHRVVIAGDTLYGDTLYVLPGRISATQDTGAIEAFNIKTDGELVPFGPTGVAAMARDGYVAVVENNSVYLTGGFDGSGTATMVGEAATISAQAINAFTSGSSFAMARAYPAVCMVGNTVTVVGGTSGGSNPLADLEFAGAGAQFGPSPGASLVTGRYGAAGAFIGNNLYVIGGVSIGNGVSDDLGTIERITVK